MFLCVRRKKDNSFQFFFFVDISVEDHARFVYLFGLLFLWILLFTF